MAHSATSLKFYLGLQKFVNFFVTDLNIERQRRRKEKKARSG